MTRKRHNNLKAGTPSPERFGSHPDDTPRTDALHDGMSFCGDFGIANAYNAMRRHAQMLEREVNRLRANTERHAPSGAR